LIGNKIIVLYGGSQKVPSIEDGDVIAVEKIESTEEMISVLSENNKNLLGITSAFKTISKNILEGKGTVGMLLNDERLYNEVDQTLQGLKKASVNAQALTAGLSEYTAKLNKKGGLANDLATDTAIMQDVRATMSKLNEAVTSANTMIASANVMVTNLKTASADLNSNSKSPIGVLLHDEQTASNLKGMIKNLEMGTEKLDENMMALRSNFLFRRYFKKKAKEDEKNPPKEDLKVDSKE
jgi:phospholipid/cholesterol/gamma-HCH transport system substrate-binding protein